MPSKRMLIYRKITGNLSPERAEFLLTGKDPFSMFPDVDRNREAWKKHRAEIMKLCSERFGPGRRPWAWWRFEHPDLFRRQIGGTGTPACDMEDAPAWTLENNFGRPRGTWAETCTEIPEPIYESEAECLERAGLLTHAERKALAPDGHFKIPHLWPGQNPPPPATNGK